MSPSFHLVILGADNPVGRALTEQAQAQNLSIHAIDVSDWDLTDLAKMHNHIKELAPTFLINCLMPASEHMALDAASVLSQVCSAQSVPLVQVSSNAVFSGQEGEVFSEDDMAIPQGLLGIDTLEIEDTIRDSCEQHLILRVGWMFSAQGHDDISKIIELAKKYTHLTLSDRKLLCPTSACDIATVLLAMTQQAHYGELWGTYHYSSAEPTNLYSFAEVVVAEARQYEELSVVGINADVSSEMNTHFSESTPKLNNKKLLYTFGIQPKTWRQALSRVLKKRYA